jgi:hypothetical protein
MKDSIKKVSDKNSIEIPFIPEQILKMKHDGQLENGKTYLFALERRKNKYVIPGNQPFQ